MSESLHLPSTNKIPDDAGMENKRGCDVIDGTSPQVKRLKNNAGLMSEGELSMKAKISTIASSEDAEADRANNQGQETSNLIANKRNSILSNEKTHDSLQLTPVESETGNNQMEGNYNSVANDHISIDENEKTHGGHQLTLVEADAAEDKGSRHTMEDAWVVLLDASLGTPGKLRCGHFAIYDGHGGRLAAEYARTHLHANVLSAGLPRSWQDGATAVCAWILGQTVFIANIGDAKAVLARSTTSNDDQKNSDKANFSLKAIVVTREHKAIYPQERARIQKAGGYVGANGRLQGRLEVSRAFGDRQFKKVFSNLFQSNL